ncbi:MAG: hypothetical protein ACTSRP_19170 [Candidatus Helarchaeota archaeon]
MNNDSQQTDKISKYDIFWSIMIYVIFNVISSIGVIIGLVSDYILFTGVLILLNIIATVLSFLGVNKEKKAKKEIDARSKTSIFFRKLFNIIGGLIAIGICWILGPWMTLFILIAFLAAFLVHEMLYVNYKRKTFFTNAILALGRDTGQEKIFWPTINSLAAFSFVIGNCTIFYYFYFGTDFIYQFLLTTTTVILLWGVGDSTAYYMGTSFGKKKLPWNEEKSYMGSFGFFIIGTIICLIILSPYMAQIFDLEPLLEYSYSWIWVSIATSFLGAFVESLNLRITDNFTVPAITALFLTLCVIIF